jgi:hypothetical protein
MSTEDIINELDQMTITDSEDYEKLDRIEELTQYLRQNENGKVACESMIKLLERHPEVEFGSPGEPIHTLETFDGHYENHLFESLERRPTEMTIWMLNRIINSKKGNEKSELLKKLAGCSIHNLASEAAKESARDFLEYQLE